MGLALVLDYCNCCGEPSPCNICTDSSTQLQVTISDTSQVNSPPLAPDPPCACTTLNKIFVLDYGSSDPPIGDCLTPDADGNSCVWNSAEESCFGIGTTSSYSVDVFLFNYLGSTYALISFIISESDALDGLTGAWNYEGIGLVAATETVDCSAIDVTISLSTSCGGPDDPVWCGGTITARLEGI